jgi:uncharacterized protein (TIGR00730 family)
MVMPSSRVEDRRVLDSAVGDIARQAASIGDEFRAGFEVVARIDRPAVTLFGSARVDEHSDVYARARETARLFVHAGFAVVTGGGPGVMEAANRGAQEAGGLSVGFNIELSHEQEANQYIDLLHTFQHFYARKTMLVKAAEGFVLFPGGFGTLDELFESLTLIQTGKVLNFPVVLFDTDYWGELLDWVRSEPLADGMISADDLDLLFATDDAAEAVGRVVTCYEQRCALAPAEPQKADAQ